MTAIAKIEPTSIIEEVIAKGDLKALSADQRAEYYTKVCESIGLNPFSQPFQYIVLNGKLQLYATKGATDQLNRIHGISVRVDKTEIINDVYVVWATGQDATGRQGSDIGAVNIKGLYGDGLANAMMKATTKAKRRVTMSMCGLGMLDETEVDSIPSAQRVPFEGQVTEVSRPQPIQIAPASTETNDAEANESFDGRLADALEMPSEPQKKLFNALYKEAVDEKDTDKLRLLIKFAPTYAQANNILNSATDKHGLNTQAMVDALKHRDDAPAEAEFVDVSTGEIEA